MMESLPTWLAALKPQNIEWNGIGVLTASVPLKLLKPNTGQLPGVPKNPRRWDADAVSLLAKSLQDTPELLAARGLLCVAIDTAAVVIGGNMRLAAAKEAGIDMLPCIFYSSDTPSETLRAIALKDNGSFGSWDFDLLAADWSDFDFSGCGISVPVEDAKPAKEEAEDDGYTEEQADTAPTRVKPGDVWQLGFHRLICGDSTDATAIARLMGGELADLLLTDPPYNVAYVGHGVPRKAIENDKKPAHEFAEFLTKAFRAADGVMKPGAAFYIWHASIACQQVLEALENAGWRERQTLEWVKNAFVIGWGDYLWQHEPCLYGWKDGGAHYFIGARDESTVIEDKPDYSAMSKQELVDYIDKLKAGINGTVLRYKRPTRSDEHPTMKPVGLMGRLVRNSSRPGDIVLDIFGGGGSTLIACEQLGRRCFMSELDPHYCDVIVDRWEACTGQKAAKIKEDSK